MATWSNSSPRLHRRGRFRDELVDLDPAEQPLGLVELVRFTLDQVGVGPVVALALGDDLAAGVLHIARVDELLDLLAGLLGVVDLLVLGVDPGALLALPAVDRDPDLRALGLRDLLALEV